MLNYFLHPWTDLKEELSVSQLNEWYASYGKNQRDMFLKKMLQCKLNKQIADEMGLSIKAIEKHKKILMQELGVTNNYGLVKYGIEHGLINDPNIPLSSLQLTPRQLAVLKLTSEGMSNKDIARNLTISEKTLEKFHAQIIGRVNLNPPTMIRYIRFALQVFPQ